MESGGCVYIVTNKNRTTLYTGVTSDLHSRMREHKTHYYPKSFTAKYNCEFLVYYKFYPLIEEAIAFEKKIKDGSREKKVALINEMNPGWMDLFEDL
ncbi:MAG TPA: GIY-YIG nuclease family protein [Pedobacter sp.]|jgi:putative endonuclease